jgi:SAM-dependent methyltransferase
MADATRDPVVAHFTAQANGYAAQSASWPWAWLRARELHAVMTQVGAVRGSTALELGCGSGFYTRALLAAGATRVVAVDRTAAMVAQLPAERVQGLVADAASVSLSERFPLILIAGMLEFVADPDAVLATAARHAGPAARLVVLAPRDDLAGRLYRAWHGRHGISIQLYSHARLDAIARATGWSLDRWSALAPFNGVASFTLAAAA